MKQKSSLSFKPSFIAQQGGEVGKVSEVALVVRRGSQCHHNSLHTMGDNQKLQSIYLMRNVTAAQQSRVA